MLYAIARLSGYYFYVIWFVYCNCFLRQQTSNQARILNHPQIHWFHIHLHYFRGIREPDQRLQRRSWFYKSGRPERPTTINLPSLSFKTTFTLFCYMDIYCVVRTMYCVYNAIIFMQGNWESNSYKFIKIIISKCKSFFIHFHNERGRSLSCQLYIIITFGRIRYPVTRHQALVAISYTYTIHIYGPIIENFRRRKILHPLSLVDILVVAKTHICNF